MKKNLYFVVDSLDNSIKHIFHDVNDACASRFISPIVERMPNKGDLKVFCIGTVSEYDESISVSSIDSIARQVDLSVCSETVSSNQSSDSSDVALRQSEEIQKSQIV